MKNKIRNRIRYEFDHLMSKGPVPPFLLLILSGLIFLLILSACLTIFNLIPKGSNVVGLPKGGDYNFFDAFWVVLLRTLDGGVLAEDPLDTSFLIFMLISTLFGLLMTSVFIGVVSSTVMDKIMELRKGRSMVLAKNHTVILGWSFQVFQIISELVIANENQKGSTIVILAEKDKVEMDDEIRAKVGDTKNTKVITRTGNPIDLRDLEIVNLNQAKSIIVIAPDVTEPDSYVIKTILAITNNPNRKPLPEKYHIVAEIRHPRNVPIAEIAGRDEVQLVVFDYVISRIIAQTCRQPGLSVVFSELLDFKGDEIYFAFEPKLIGKTFVEALFAYENSMVIGLRKFDGTILLKPPMNTRIEEGDKIIAISEDDDTILLSGLLDYKIDPGAIREEPKLKERTPENTLILGWNRRAPLIINELDKYVTPNSKLVVVTDLPYAERTILEMNYELKNHEISFIYGDTTDRRVLDNLVVEQFDHIIVLAQTEMLDVQSVDARTLSTLLHLRDIADRTMHRFSIVSEMLDDRNRELAEITHADDFIVSVRLDSLLLSQISENRELKTIFEILFSASNPSIFIKPAEFYVELGRPVNFYTVLESARERDEIAIGYKLRESKPRYQGDSMLAYGVRVNPIKSNRIFFSEGDKIIVIGDE
ncbi:MAG: NAD-binding protein [Ignavibacteria bacterium]|nr:NAD-binding protein [Ignavibacteria bacterium]